MARVIACGAIWLPRWVLLAVVMIGIVAPVPVAVSAPADALAEGLKQPAEDAARHLADALQTKIVALRAWWSRPPPHARGDAEAALSHTLAQRRVRDLRFGQATDAPTADAHEPAARQAGAADETRPHQCHAEVLMLASLALQKCLQEAPDKQLAADLARHCAFLDAAGPGLCRALLEPALDTASLEKGAWEIGDGDCEGRLRLTRDTLNVQFDNPRLCKGAGDQAYDSVEQEPRQ